MDVIGGKVFSNRPKNMNHVHKDTKYLFSVIITLGTNTRGGDTALHDGVKTYYLGIRYHVLKHLHGRMGFDPFEKNYHEDNLWRGPRAVMFFIINKHFFVDFYRHGDRFYNQYINKKI